MPSGDDGHGVVWFDDVGVVHTSRASRWSSTLWGQQGPRVGDKSQCWTYANRVVCDRGATRSRDDPKGNTMKIRRYVRTLRAALARSDKDAGMTTAEYAVGTLATCALAAVLLAIVQSGGIKDLITSVIETALSVAL